jgi:radical S-adenosyl methionine domain-containing protein 2
LPETNRRIGRYGRADPPNVDQYQRIADRVRGGDIRLKINTVINRFNLNETIGGEISSFRPFRWKIFQAKQVFGQNDVGFENLAVSAAEFNEYVTRNRRLVQTDFVIVPETADDMTGSYVMIAPNGCFFDITLGYHRYSRPILEVGILEAFRDVEFSQDKFVKRGGLYA